MDELTGELRERLDVVLRDIGSAGPSASRPWNRRHLGEHEWPREWQTTQ